MKSLMKNNKIRRQALQRCSGEPQDDRDMGLRFLVFKFYRSV